jgi:hypothetical protein
MKICPRCQKTYNDDNLNFCLDDGVVLQQAPAPPPETVLMNQPPMTDPRAGTPTRPALNTAPQPYPTQPKKSSKAWLWAVLVLGVVVLLCGGGMIGFFAYVASTVDTNTVTNSTPSNSTTVAANRSTRSTPAPTTTSDTRDNVQEIDLSEWVKDFSVYGTTEFTDGEFRMASKQKGYYYVLVAPDDYTTEGANTRVTLRNIDDANSSLGYGLIFHSNPSPLTQDYALLIDTKKKKYRVVRHEPTDEKTVIAWTNSSTIKEGTNENMLEVRDRPDNNIELYINGQLVNTIPNTYGYKNGVPGLYAGDAAKIAFKDLEISK